MSNKQIVIVGAGVSGLTIGYELARIGNKVIVIEKEDKVGGLAKSFRYNGFTFDIGPHRFHTDNPSTLQFIKHILNDETVNIRRHSGVQVLGRYYTWPLRPVTLIQLPLSIMVRSGIDLLFNVSKKADNEDNFKDYVCKRYGPTIYEIFFRKYTEKFFGLSADEMHSEWAKASIAKAVIDKHINLRNLFDILRFTIMPAPIRTEFIYPKKGIGLFCDRLAERIIQMGGQVLTNSAVTDIGFSKDKIIAVACNGAAFKPDRLVWTGSLLALSRLLGSPRPNLDYLSLLLFNIELNKPLRNSYQWCYYSGEEIIFNRVSSPVLFSRDLVPEGKSSLCVELTCRENDERWNKAESLIDQVKKDLIKVNFIKKSEDISSVHVERVSDAYPIYKLGYRQEIRKAEENLNKFKNLSLAGRTGLFWFNNMDECIENALVLAEDTLRE